METIKKLQTVVAIATIQEYQVLGFKFGISELVEWFRMLNEYGPF
ncbi:MAG: hypothetical protein WBB28_01725 [Crinalium sp.]